MGIVYRIDRKKIAKKSGKKESKTNTYLTIELSKQIETSLIEWKRSLHHFIFFRFFRCFLFLPLSSYLEAGEFGARSNK